MNMIGQMAIAIALPGFNDLGRSVTRTFLCSNIFYLQLSPHCPKMNKKSSTNNWRNGAEFRFADSLCWFKG